MAATALRVTESAGASLVSWQGRKDAWLSVVPITGAAGASSLAARLVDGLGGCAVVLDDNCVQTVGPSSRRAVEAIRSAEAVFLVSTPDRASIEQAQAYARRISMMRETGPADDMEDSGVALILLEDGLKPRRVEWLTPAAAEDLAGIPVCALIANEADLNAFCEFVRAEHERASAIHEAAL